MRSLIKRRLPVWVVAGCLASLVCLRGGAEIFGPVGGEKRAEEKAGEPTLGEKTELAARQADAENQRRFGKDADYLLRPGLLANKKEKWVKLSGRATGISEHDPVEFFTIPMDSGKDYESMSVVFARPSDVHAALEFIGMKPGRPVNYARAQFWPKGERVSMTFEWEEPGKEDAARKARSAAAEELILDHRTKKAIPTLGLVFTGSYMITPEDGGKPMYGADVSDSRSIASDYNDPSTVLDVPHQWVKGQVYGALKPNPAYRFAAGQPVAVTLRPEKRENGARVVDLTLEAGPGAEKGLARAAFGLSDAQGKAVVEKGTLAHVLAHFEKLAGEKRDPFVTVKVDGKLSLGEVRELFNLIRQMDRVEGIRVEAPPAGQLFYRAFFPEEEWRDRDKRLGRPWELHVNKKDGKLGGELILPADAIDDNQGRGDLKFAVGSAEEMAKVLAEKSDRWSRTVYVFVDGAVGYGELLGLIGPSMKTHETVYVFLK